MVKEVPEAIEAALDSNKHQPAIATNHNITEFYFLIFGLNFVFDIILKLCGLILRFSGLANQFLSLNIPKAKHPKKNSEQLQKT